MNSLYLNISRNALSKSNQCTCWALRAETSASRESLAFVKSFLWLNCQSRLFVTCLTVLTVARATYQMLKAIPERNLCLQGYLNIAFVPDTKLWYPLFDIYHFSNDQLFLKIKTQSFVMTFRSHQVLISPVFF